ncbi:MAG: bifunctional diaminohydroxyphosphoribosylaminopyrimidine deaminase/5-amino-6-(5-phosphoribosylamino)uracil reductase RibD [Bacteroidota bacterium]|nr:bifunctional diaminohydroxyphosphoribosylaminopyrimidine deaminase/5-amino-6-(5-phosphoribosylamino)uracil reductase RibD [Bacteroidota bacterium]
MKQSNKQIDELFMMECIALAERGGGYVSPNPMVGAVLVKNRKVIGRGYHTRFGRHHAEVNAIGSARTSVHGSTLYVNLEPCSYYGKTPPCTDLIIKNKISKVVVGMLDPNPLVSGKGIRKLKRAGIKVEVGILNEECKKQNEAFTKFITTGLPFVTLKVAQTLDGKIADISGKSKWITNELSQQIVHHLRSRNDAVLVGANTVNIDNPELTVRKSKGRNPVRIVLDGGLKANSNASMFTNNKSRTILFTSTRSARANNLKIKKLLNKGVEIIELPAMKKAVLSLKLVLRKLGELGIASVLVEGGANTFSNFVSDKLADKLLIFTAPKIFGKGIDGFIDLENQTVAKHVRLSKVSIRNLDGDILIEGYF